MEKKNKAVSDSPPRDEGVVDIDIETKARSYDQIVVKGKEVKKIRGVYLLARDKSLECKKAYDTSSVELTDLIEKLAEPIPIGPLFPDPPSEEVKTETEDPPEKKEVIL